jgi:hypothetical protein
MYLRYVGVDQYFLVLRSHEVNFMSWRWWNKFPSLPASDRDISYITSSQKNEYAQSSNGLRLATGWTVARNKVYTSAGSTQAPSTKSTEESFPGGKTAGS